MAEELKERNEAVRRMRAETESTLEQIGAHFGISRERVRQICHGRVTESPRLIRVQERRKKIVEFVAQKKSSRTIAALLDMNIKDVFNDIRCLGLESVSVVEERLAVGLQRCYRCHENKPVAEFTKGNSHSCRTCAYKATSAWIAKNRERHNASQNRWHKKRYWRLKAEKEQK